VTRERVDLHPSEAHVWSYFRLRAELTSPLVINVGRPLGGARMRSVCP